MEPFRWKVAVILGGLDNIRIKPGTNFTRRRGGHHRVPLL